MELWNLKPAVGSRKKSRRLGRGEGSGVGKTCGRGGKGQTARAGASIRPGFEGGQMPLYRRLPKMGFVSSKKVRGLNIFQLVNLTVLERLDAGTTVDPALLEKMGYAPGLPARGGLKILASGTLTKKLHVKAHAFSRNARSKIEAVGGTAEVITQ